MRCYKVTDHIGIRKSRNHWIAPHSPSIHRGINHLSSRYSIDWALSTSSVVAIQYQRDRPMSTIYRTIYKMDVLPTTKCSNSLFSYFVSSDSVQRKTTFETVYCVSFVFDFDRQPADCATTHRTQRMDPQTMWTTPMLKRVISMKNMMAKSAAMDREYEEQESCVMDDMATDNEMVSDAEHFCFSAVSVFRFVFWSNPVSLQSDQSSYPSQTLEC